MCDVPVCLTRCDLPVLLLSFVMRVEIKEINVPYSNMNAFRTLRLMTRLVPVTPYRCEKDWTVWPGAGRGGCQQQQLKVSSIFIVVMDSNSNLFHMEKKP